MSYTWDFSVVWYFRGALLVGLWTSIQLTLFGIVAGTVFGTILTVVSRHVTPSLSLAVSAFTEVARALPVLVVMICAYYMVPPLTGLPVSAFWIAALSLAFNMAGFASEILNGSINDIPREHVEAGYALGMSQRMVLRRIVLPEAFKRSIPAFIAMSITIFKQSTVASVISVYELLHSANSIILDQFKPLEVYTAVAMMYLLTILPATFAANRIQRHRWFALSPGEDQ